MPSKHYHIDLASARTTTSATLEDIADLTVTTVRLPKPGTIQAFVTADVDNTSAAASTIALTVNINSVDGHEIQRDIAAANDVGAVAIGHTEIGLAAGVYTVKGRFRRVAGAPTCRTNRMHLNITAIWA